MQYAVDGAFEVYSYVDKSLMNEDVTNQSGGSPKYGGKQGNMSMNEIESNFEDDEASGQENGGREAMSPPFNDVGTPMQEAPR